MAEQIEPARPAEPPRSRRRYGTGRMEAFSDGVFAFAITLLVLDLVIPESAGDRDLWGAFLSVWPQYLTYVVSFATIGATWLSHLSLSERLDHADSTFIRLNLLLLMFVAFIPFPTRFLSQYIDVEQSERVAVVIYGLSFLLLFGMILVLWRYAKMHRLLDGDAERSEDRVSASADARIFSTRLIPGIGAYPVLIVIGLVVPMVAVFGYLALALFFMIPSRPRRGAAKGHDSGKWSAR